MAGDDYAYCEGCGISEEVGEHHCENCLCCIECCGCEEPAMISGGVGAGDRPAPRGRSGWCYESGRTRPSYYEYGNGVVTNTTDKCVTCGKRVWGAHNPDGRCMYERADGSSAGFLALTSTTTQEDTHMEVQYNRLKMIDKLKAKLLEAEANLKETEPEQIEKKVATLQLSIKEYEQAIKKLKARVAKAKAGDPTELGVNTRFRDSYASAIERLELIEGNSVPQNFGVNLEKLAFGKEGIDY